MQIFGGIGEAHGLSGTALVPPDPTRPYRRRHRQISDTDPASHLQTGRNCGWPDVWGHRCVARYHPPRPGPRRVRLDQEAVIDYAPAWICPTLRGESSRPPAAVLDWGRGHHCGSTGAVAASSEIWSGPRAARRTARTGQRAAQFAEAGPRWPTPRRARPRLRDRAWVHPSVDSDAAVVRSGRTSGVERSEVAEALLAGYQAAAIVSLAAAGSATGGVPRHGHP